ncbi:MAG: VWA domain-containing protein [Deltaproteobacteria bacterium]|nr:VWA domain-containing protein [Deltaproteobacteria bacterium]
MKIADTLKRLNWADPELFQAVKTSLDHKAVSVSKKDVVILVEETLWALSMETSFGQSVAKGYADLIGEASSENFYRYRELIRRFGRKGPTLGRIMAEHLVPVLKQGGSKFLKRFLKTLMMMQSKGTYTLKDPLDELSKLLNEKDFDSAYAYIDLLGDTFSGKMSYVQSQNFAYNIPRAVRSFSVSRRAWQIKQLHRVIKADHRLLDPFLLGMKKGLYLLSQDALDNFISLTLNKLNQRFKLAAKFLSLESQLGIDTYSDMQVTVPLSQVRQQLNNYLQARTRLSISVKSMSNLPAPMSKAHGQETFVCSDGKFIYLPDEISKFFTKDENKKLYKCLTRLEAGLYEFGTFDFDLEKATEKCLRFKGTNDQSCELNSILNNEHISDLKRFFLLFPVPELADDLFTAFEHGRIRLLLNRQYPGLIRQTLPVLQQEALDMIKQKEHWDAVFLLYLKIALNVTLHNYVDLDEKTAVFIEQMEKRFKTAMAADHTVETCAELVTIAYPYVDTLLKASETPENLEEIYNPIPTPFGWRVRSDLFFMSHLNFEQTAAKLNAQLANKGYQVYKSDIRRKLIANKGIISHEDIKSILLDNQNTINRDMPNRETSVDLSWLDLSQLHGSRALTPLISDDDNGTVFLYKEWDCNLHDYLLTHVRVLDKSMPEFSDDFYISTLKQHQGLVQNIRYAFELLRPEGLIRLRQWVEGDEFDYRSLLDFAIDKKAGRIPSDRLYIKHIKQTRDVAVLLLVDLSRSTSNTVYNSEVTILRVEKEAIVLFCEALQVVGDAFAIAGFSSTGPLGVDYLRIKNFEENLDDRVKQRINAMSPQRNTRMGAAIRHAACQLENISSKVRLLIILSDGFPNDVDYKHKYAIEDTRKAIFEARSKNIFTHAITVHFAGDPKLDDLYGNVHHNVISDIRELPDKLLRIYGSLTRQ